jgi:segregation and condensation protein A
VTASPPLTVAGTETPFVVQLDAFSGPLDLLLHLIREQEIDVTDIPIAQIADQFLTAIDALGLNDAADYLAMAAQLLRIKVQMLLPRPFDDEEWDDPRAELVRRLLEYEQIREVAKWLQERASFRADRFARGWMPEPPDLGPRPLLLDVEELLHAVERAVEAMPQPVAHRVVPRPLDVEGATRRILAVLEIRERVAFADLFGDGGRPNVADVVSALLALLELARIGRARLEQPEPFGLLTIVRESAYAAA